MVVPAYNVSTREAGAGGGEGGGEEGGGDAKKPALHAQGLFCHSLSFYKDS